MDLGAAGLSEQPFRTDGKPLTVVSYASQQEALKVLDDTRRARQGLSLLQGPTLSGKTTLIRHFVDKLPEDCAVAVVDGTGLNTSGLLEAVLHQYGYVLHHSSIAERLAMLRVFALQQAASHEPPLLIIENTHLLNPSALRTLCRPGRRSDTCSRSRSPGRSTSKRVCSAENSMFSARTSASSLMP